MSIQIMGAVWSLSLSHSELLVLLALSDHADHEGENVRPGIPLIAWKTGYSERQVQRVMGRLEACGILQVTQVRDSDGRPRVYRIDLSNATRKDPYERRPSGRPPQAGNPVTFATKPGDIRDKPGDIAMSPEPSVEPSPESTSFAGSAADGAEGGGATAVEVRKAGRVTVTAEMEGVYDDWKLETGRRATLDQRRAEKIRDRLKDGYTRAHLRLAVAGAVANDYFRVDNPQYLLPETLFRDEGAVERHMARARSSLSPEPWWPAAEHQPSAAPQQPYDDMRIRAADIGRIFGGGS